MAPNFKFTVDLKPTLGARHGTRFPNDNCVGLKLVNKDKARNVFELRIFVPEAIAKKAQMKMGGIVMGQISDCSKALRILWSDSKNPQFKGYAMRQVGTWMKAKEREKMHGQIHPFSANIAVPSSKINISKTKAFDIAYPDVLDARKGQFTVDIAKLSLISIATK